MNEILQRRRALMGTQKSGPRLPAEYQEVEYLTSADNTANRYVSTQIATNDVASVKLAFAKESGRPTIIVCNYDGSGLNTPFGSLENTAGYGFSCSPRVDRYSLCDKTDFTFSKTNTASVTGSLCLMGWKLGSNVAKGKLYSVSLFDADNVKLGDFVPCYRKADTAIGLYDIVKNRFCQQTGGIGKGPDVT